MDVLRFNKFRIDEPISWRTHRGGWSYIVDIIQNEFHTPDGTLFISAVENVIVEGVPIEEPWTGFIHQVPKSNLPFFPDLERLLKHETWLASLNTCKGIYTISKYLKDYLDKQSLPFPVNYVPYAVDNEFKEFNYDVFEKSQRSIVFVGEYMRNFEAFSVLQADNYEKLLLVTETFTRQGHDMSDSVKLINRVTDEEYDILLSENIVFLNLYDAPANTTVVECLARNTPILINRLPGVIEYLGEDYPFYYSSLKEASEKLADDELIKRTSEYLMNSPNKEKLRKEYFINTIHSGSIYRSLPIPKNQKAEGFKEFDITVVITSYKRLYNIDNLLSAFCKQEFEGSFELILWNNNFHNNAELDALYQKYSDRLTIRLIHSSENYYCAMRLVMGQLMRSDYLLICDDDVKPGPNYISTFWENSMKYGPESVLCARGHIFDRHELDEQNPEKVWESYENIKFYNESREDIQIHFFHADNCLIPKSVLLKVNGYEWDSLDFILVDDYWMSYIISHELGLPIWKIQFDAHMEFTPCAESETISLFRNPKVRSERLKFYVYHMQNGWPNSVIDSKNGTAKTGNYLSEHKDSPVVKKVSEIESSHFKSYDLSVLICTYSRVHNLANLLQCFVDQDYEGSFEIVVWNNNIVNNQALEDLLTQYKDRLELKVLNSTKNYYCIPRIALTSLLRGKNIVFCDDDIVPKPNYLSYLHAKYLEFGPNALVTSSGDSFLTTDMDEDHPHLVWWYGGVTLHSIDQEETLVNVFHGNSCIVSKEIMKKAITYPLPSLEIALVDDYWLSYLFNKELGVKLVKIKGDEMMTLTQDSDDGSIAMYRNKHVRYQKIAFNLYHRQKNWTPMLDTSDPHG